MKLLLAAVALATAGSTLATAAPYSPRSGCAIVSDAGGDTAADVGAPTTLPQSDAALDIVGVDLAANGKWIGARVHLMHLDAKAPTTGGESFEVTLSTGGGTLILGAGRYANATGIVGDDKFAYAGFQRGTLAPRDVPARAVQVSLNPLQNTISVYVERQALSDIGAFPSGYATQITAVSGRQYGDEFTVDYDSATGSNAYRLGAASCLRLPA